MTRKHLLYTALACFLVALLLTATFQCAHAEEPPQFDTGRSHNKGLSWPTSSMMKINPYPTVDALLIVGENGEKIVSIAADGTVKVFKEGQEPEAARIFYEALRKTAGIGWDCKEVSGDKK